MIYYPTYIKKKLLFYFICLLKQKSCLNGLLKLNQYGFIMNAETFYL